MNNNEFLPIGSVVLLKGANTELMIIGYKSVVKVEDKEEQYDYVGCRLSQGIRSKSHYKFFNRDQIYKVIFVGYEDETWEKIKKDLN